MEMNKHEKTKKQGYDLSVLSGGYGPLPNGFTVAELFKMHFIIKREEKDYLLLIINLVIYMLLIYIYQPQH